MQALRHYGYDGLTILVSERRHYPLRKVAGVLGIGCLHLIQVPVDAADRIRIDALRAAVRDLQRCNICPMAIVGMAGTTEMGAIDPLDALADVAREANCHFHVDAAWGGASLMSARHRPERWQGRAIVLFRVVLANPTTTRAMLDDILAKQRMLASVSSRLPDLMALTSG
ncbi:MULTISPECIES: pyridoxal-dependent decarboxylase [Mycetohabitans]|uniref:Pyridoxal-dependent decarboxylase-like protein n=1 Tax=Mycetohabitans endofungorum TaxID=417203 RepID=A0A2P5KD36_9BURK|nr:MULTISPECIES: pyridoxal-dependent decarboxylase [Mycetohabitans]PPB84602.1 pyridoxal-dependent decarboxylase-like protein [Mycetohabitans endofungorum]